ncbi:hypothetical protein NQ176_g10029 [Zarea fungicola]|uniref:Uncharacterized protein n=1 Tax=Zarea fungicola TaxID=93591 RepID=A0ACC1MKD8_9HYPO|nr:hypothetical protein NQ176_g10029 [Lecanicillium fungicola]
MHIILQRQVTIKPGRTHTATDKWLAESARLRHQSRLAMRLAVVENCQLELVEADYHAASFQGSSCLYSWSTWISSAQRPAALLCSRIRSSSGTSSSFIGHTTATFARFSSFELEKCRLFNWGFEMGLCDDERQNLLEGWHFHGVATDCLQQIIHLLSDARSIRDRYGGVASNAETCPTIEDVPHRYPTGVALAFGNFQTRQPPKDSRRTGLLHKTKWIIRDRAKFSVLVGDVRTLVDGLQDITKEITSATRLDDALQKRIDSILDASALLNIASAWKDSHPRISSSASTRAESLSCVSENAKRVIEWRAGVRKDTDNSTEAADIESLPSSQVNHAAGNATPTTENDMIILAEIFSVMDCIFLLILLTFPMILPLFQTQSTRYEVTFPPFGLHAGVQFN